MRRWALAMLVGCVGLLGCESGRSADGAEGEGEGESSGPATCEVATETAAFNVALPDVDAALKTGGVPDLGCIGAPRTVGASTQVTLEGCIDVFGVGNDAKKGTEIAVFAASVDPSTGTPLATGIVAVRNDASGLVCDGADANAPACLAFACSSKGYYRLSATVPTHEPLTMRIKHPTDTTVIDTYLYGLTFFNEQATDAVVSYEAAMIFRSTWDSIPTLGGRQITGGQDGSDGVGRAVVAGEIHDCNDVIIEGASVTIGGLDSTMSIAYFDGDPDDPKPDLRRITTANDGLYVLLNVPTDAGANEHTIVAGLREPGCVGDDCSCVSAGERTIKTFADSVTIVTLRGDFPVIQ